ncbi:hypothetical protein EVAR_4954_1 [Eumeta japonica]|uniref:Uncharacterized protein n=1 Tax=Eumeta variegata TaxID=151549 RepID=A0A4C1UZ24_EUMVA|nr:hypothetical protein EVAR_4954_1 [Eumeta japonica]
MADDRRKYTTLHGGAPAAGTRAGLVRARNTDIACQLKLNKADIPHWKYRYFYLVLVLRESAGLTTTIIRGVAVQGRVRRRVRIQTL